ncbi:MAG: aminopeptidase [Bacteroidota bacterium]|jgi:predicted aminopeptidase
MILLQKQIKRQRKRQFWTAFIVLIISLLIWQWSWVDYFYQQAKGGLSVAFNTRPLNEVLQDKTVPDSLKKRILYIQEVRKYAIDSLGLRDNPDVYQTLFDQKGQPLVHLLTVAERYKMEAKMFDYPIVGLFIGNFSYKGFFDSTTAAKEQTYWKNQGYDTEMGQGIAYSTLGWLPEPILSNMLYYSDGKLASLIIHEMTHGTIFVKNNHETSENLANFIGDYGAKRFLKYKYGSDSQVFKRYAQSRIFRDKFIKHLNRGTLKLDSLYRNFKPNYSSKYKDSLKYALIEKIERSQDTIYAKLKHLPKHPFNKNDLPNNAFFVSFKTYNSKQNEFETIFKQQFGNNFDAFLKSMKSKHNE